jgi:hypothetical protein
MATPSKRLARRPAGTVSKRLAAAPPATDEEDDEIPPAPTLDDDDEGDDVATNGDADIIAKRKKMEGSMTAAQRTMDSTSSFAKAFQPSETLQAIKFLQDKPYATFRRHWIEGTNRESGQRSVRAYTCPLSFDDPCPLCEAGDKPQAVAAFNVAVLDENGGVIRYSWEVGARLFGVIKSFSNDPKVAPLSRHYFLVNKTGKRQNVQYNCNPVRATALTEDYQIPVPDQAELDRLELYDVSIIPIEKRSTLRELASSLSDE